MANGIVKWKVLDSLNRKMVLMYLFIIQESTHLVLNPLMRVIELHLTSSKGKRVLLP